MPNGIPMIVSINAILPTKYSKAMASPPNTSQIKLQMVFIIYLTAIISISTRAPLGKSLTAKAERAGNVPLNWVA